MRTYLEPCDILDQDIFGVVLRGRQGREDQSDKMQEACGAGVGLGLCIRIEDGVWLT
jgi:hypothetical protein